MSEYDQAHYSNVLSLIARDVDETRQYEALVTDQAGKEKSSCYYWQRDGRIRTPAGTPPVVVEAQVTPVPPSTLRTPLTPPPTPPASHTLVPLYPPSPPKLPPLPPSQVVTVRAAKLTWMARRSDDPRPSNMEDSSKGRWRLYFSGI